MKKLIALILAGVMITGAATAFPAHVQDGYRDTGCDPAQQTLNAAGQWNNPTCPEGGDATNDPNG